MTTTPANQNRFSRNMGEYRTSETTSEGRMLALFSYYGIWAETKIRALDWSVMACEKCRFEAEGLTPAASPLFLSFDDSVKGETCKKCSQKTLFPQVYLPDFVLSRKRKVVVEVYGEKSSTFDKAKLDFYKRAGITMIPVPNELTEQPKSAKALCAALAIAVGSSHPERLTEEEIG